MPQIKDRESGLVKFQSQEDINKKKREERRQRRELVLNRIQRILNDKENQQKNS